MSTQTSQKQIDMPTVGTGRYWIFDNGQFGEKIEITEQSHYSILYGSDGSELGLSHWKSNNTGNSRFFSACYSLVNLGPKLLEIYNQLK